MKKKFIRMLPLSFLCFYSFLSIAQGTWQSIIDLSAPEQRT